MGSRPTQGRGDSSTELRTASGRQLRAWRLAAGKTQQEIAREVGFAYYTMISQLELGRSHVPPERYEAYAKALGIDVRVFVSYQLRWSNPWAWAILFGTDADLEHARQLPERLTQIEGK
jgi:transcriptional regulator with XRE-family HTH domain